MAITALLIMVVAAGVAARVVGWLYSTLIGRGSRLWLLVVAIAGLGYGLEPRCRRR